MKVGIRLLAYVAAMMCCGGVGGCVLGVPGVDDLNFVAVDVVKTLDQPEIGPGNLPERLIKVTFSSRRNLFQYEHNYNWYMYGRFYHCDNETMKQPALAPSLGTYWRNLDLDLGRRYDYPRILEELKKSETQLYHTFLLIRNEHANTPSYSSSREFAEYDLEKDPQNVCYQLSGGSMWGHFHSNIAPIPKEAIAMAFERAASRPTK